MPWWFLAYVQTGANKPASLATPVGPFRTKANATTLRTAWLAIDSTHKATNPWYADPTGQQEPFTIP